MHEVPPSEPAYTTAHVPLEDMRAHMLSHASQLYHHLAHKRTAAVP